MTYFLQKRNNMFKSEFGAVQKRGGKQGADTAKKLVKSPSGVDGVKKAPCLGRLI